MILNEEVIVALTSSN